MSEGHFILGLSSKHFSFQFVFRLSLLHSWMCCSLSNAGHNKGHDEVQPALRTPLEKVIRFLTGLVVSWVPAELPTRQTQHHIQICRIWSQHPSSMSWHSGTTSCIFIRFHPGLFWKSAAIRCVGWAWKFAHACRRTASSKRFCSVHSLSQAFGIFAFIFSSCSTSSTKRFLLTSVNLRPFTRQQEILSLVLETDRCKADCWCFGGVCWVDWHLDCVFLV